MSQKAIECNQTNHTRSTESDEALALLGHADQLAKSVNVRLTPIRRQVYKCLVEAGKPLGAYEILEKMDGIGAPKPPTVYRALDWLLELGLIRRIASISKFVALPEGQSFDPVAVLLCRDCGKVGILESNSPLRAVLNAAKSRGLADIEATLEIVGRCDGSL